METCIVAHSSVLFKDSFIQQYFLTRTIRATTAISPTVTVMAATTPPTMTTVLLLLLVSSVGLEHPSSLKLEMATGHCVSARISIPLTLMAGPEVAQFSMREKREALFTADVPLSLARYVT